MPESELEAFVLRNDDYSLEPEREALRDTFRAFLGKHCPSERVRAAEPLGWDQDLWTTLAELRPVETGLSGTFGGDDGGLVELALVCEEFGRVAAPVPLADTAVAARILAAAGGALAESVLASLLSGELATLALTSPDHTGRFLTGAGAVARFVIGQRGDEFVVAEAVPTYKATPNLGMAPVAWRTLDDGSVLASGPTAHTLAAQARAEWQLLMAATLVGLGESVTGLGVQYAKDRVAFGVPIGSFQAVAHPLVDATIGIVGARRLVWKACWLRDNEPGRHHALAPQAFVYSAECAERAGSVAMHTQGGFGFTVESDVHLFYRRAKAWPILAGDRRGELQEIANFLLG